MRFAVLIALTLPGLTAAESEIPLTVSFEEGAGRLDIRVDGTPFAVYVYADPEIPRPYFCRVMAPGGVQVTRTHPPDPVSDSANLDHAALHPGLWLAFGDLGGADFWRNKARARHARFEEPSRAGVVGTFTVRNIYETMETPPRVLCEETCRYAITATPEARWMTVESQFRAAAPEVAFGDQEEMGFGVRLATPLTVKHGTGMIANDRGDVNELGTWGKQAAWCAYSGVVEGRRAGLLLAAHPDNFRKSWFHTRDYGLMVANPFGKKSMTAPRDAEVLPDSTPLPEDKAFSLGFGVCVFSTKTEQAPDYAALHSRYLALTAGANPNP